MNSNKKYSLTDEIAQFPKGNLKKCETKVRYLGNTEQNVQDQGWRLFKDTLILGTNIEEEVAFSARYVAAIRAIETERKDALFRDEYAQVLAGNAVGYLKNLLKEQEKESKEGEKPYWCNERPYLVIRTKFMDDFAVEAMQHSGGKQVVILGSGMDTRPIRLNWLAKTMIYEIDKVEVIEWKQKLLKDIPSQCTIKYIAADLTKPWAHLLTDFDKNQPSIWIIEGLLYYLTPTENDILLKTIANLCAPGSWIGLDVVNTEECQAVSFRSAVDSPEEYFHQYNFKAEVVQPGDNSVHYGRFTRTLPQRDIPYVRRAYLVKAVKMEGFLGI